MSQVSDVLRIRADVSELAHVRQFIRDRSRLAGANRQTTDDMVQAVDELVTNSIVHGYKGGQGAIEVEVDIRDPSLIVRLRDRARAFDPTSVAPKDTSVPLSERPAGGMGIHLSREMTDEMTYQRIDGQNETTLVKKFSSEGDGPC
ncbi:MAG TPA: ATP-binding protein [Candidatus Limnocylindrales bacterium]|nr:ATP-binding protein [Candidatus Limnocylindrales bacterium]